MTPTRWILLASLLVLSPAAGAAIWVLAQGRETIDTTLVYRFEGDTKAHLWRRALELRLNGDGRKARVRITQAGELEVGVYGQDPQRLESIRWRLSRRGLMSFRVLADPRVDQEVVELAAASELADVTDSRGQLIARWVPIARRPDGTPRVQVESQPVATRLRDGQKEVLLLIEDDQVFREGAERYQRFPAGAVDQSNLLKVIFGGDLKRLSLTYYLDPYGAMALQVLTELHLPTEDQPEIRSLGFVLDDELWSVQQLTESLADRGMIPGPFTSTELRNLIALYNYNHDDRLETGGTLPTPLRLVEIRSLSDDKPAKTRPKAAGP